MNTVISLNIVDDDDDNNIDSRNVSSISERNDFKLDSKWKKRQIMVCPTTMSSRRTQELTIVRRNVYLLLVRAKKRHEMHTKLSTPTRRT